MFNFLERPTAVSAGLLLALYALALYFHQDPGFIQNESLRFFFLLLGLLPPVIIQALISGYRPQIANLLITLLILILLSDSTTQPLPMFFLGLATGLIKTLVRLDHQPIFNPAAAGLFAASFFCLLTTWWGISYSPRLPIFQMSITNFLTLPLGLYLVFLYKKIPTLIGVPFALAVSYFLLSGKLPLVTLFEGTFTFFLLIMATEPKTSPLVDYQEWVYSLALGGLLAWLFVNRLAPEPYLASLLVLNLLFSIFRTVQVRLLSR